MPRTASLPEAFQRESQVPVKSRGRDSRLPWMWEQNAEWFALWELVQGASVLGDDQDARLRRREAGGLGRRVGWADGP